MATPGTNITVFRPTIYVAVLGTVLPAMNLALGGGWPTGWKKVPYTEEGAVITPSAPQDDITADEVGGTAFTVPGTGSEINIGWTSLTPDLDLFEWLGSMGRETTAAVVGPPAYPQFHRLSLDKRGRNFMVGIEGTLDAGSLTEFGGFVRAFGYKVIQTEEVEINLRASGEESALRLGANVRCLATEVTAAQKSGTGIGKTDSRFDMFVVPATA